MTDPTYDVMPMGVIDAIDPYPFHGLVYRLQSTGFRRYLDPSDGRPAIDIPPTPSVSSVFCPEYFEAADGVLWDIGRADPPITSAIAARGGKAIGKRILDRSAVYPARLGGKTYQLGISALSTNSSSPSSPIKLEWFAPVSIGPVTPTEIATLSLADFDVDPSSLLDEDGQRLIPDGRLPLFGYSIQDVPSAISNDGTRRLFRAQIILNPGVSGSRSFTAGYVEVVFSATEAGVISASASVVKTITQVVGTVDRQASSDNKRFQAVGGGFDSGCVISYELVSYEPPAQSKYGSSLLAVERTGIVVGAVYLPDNSIEYFTANQSLNISNVVNASRASHSTGTPFRVDNDSPGECRPPAEESTTLSGSYVSDFKLTTTLRFGAFSHASWIREQREGTFIQEPGKNEELTSATLRTSSSAGTSTSRALSFEVIAVLRYGQGGPSTGLTIPNLEQTRRVTDGEIVLVTGLSGWQSTAISLYRQDSNITDDWRAPMVTPSGVKLGYSRSDGLRNSVIAYQGAYNPITGQAARTGDVPGTIISGWI